MSELVQQAIEDWYKPGVSIAEFHNTRTRIRALIGGRGSGKTSAISVEATGHGFWNAGAKIYILRKTQDSNEDTTLETFEQTFRNMGTAYVDTGKSLFKKIEGGKVFRLPSKLAVEKFNQWKHSFPAASKQQIEIWLNTEGAKYCSWLYFAGVPEARYRASRFRGYECSMLIFVEADQLSKEDLDLGVACLRWKGSDPAACDEKGFIRDTCVILDTNPPSEHHWIAQMEKDTKDDPDVRFWHIKTKENAHNLPPGYVDNLVRQYAKQPAMYARMVLGEYADAFEGQPVLFAFDLKHTGQNLPWPEGAYLVRGWDFGTTQSVIWSAYWIDGGDEYWWDLLEYFTQQSDAERQCQRVHELTQEIFPFWNNRMQVAGVKDYCDVAGNAQTDKGSSVKVLNRNGFYPGFSRMGLQESIAIYNRLLQKKDRFGNLVYRIDKETCPRLYTASIGGYRYPIMGEVGFGSDEPLKGEAGGNFDHLADASRYGKVNCMRLLVAEHEKSKKNEGPLADRKIVTRNRNYY